MGVDSLNDLFYESVLVHCYLPCCHNISSVSVFGSYIICILFYLPFFNATILCIFIYISFQNICISAGRWSLQHPAGAEFPPPTSGCNRIKSRSMHAGSSRGLAYQGILRFSSLVERMNYLCVILLLSVIAKLFCLVVM